MAQSPLTPAEYAFYSAIFETESITPSALAERLGMPLTTVMDHVARFEQRRHISRMVDPRDRRATRVVLTGDGLAAHRAANATFERAYAEFERQLPISEQVLQANLALVRDAIEEAARAAPREQTPSARHPAGEAPRRVQSRSRPR